MVKSSVWTVSVVAVGLAVLSQSVNMSYDSASATGITADIAALFDPWGALLGITFVVAAAMTFITFFSGGEF